MCQFAENSFDSYVGTALWSSTDDSEIPLNAGMYELSEQAREKLKSSMHRFNEVLDSKLDDLVELLDDRYGIDGDRVAHDLWLTQNNGAGFWDGDYPTPFDKILTDAAKKVGAVELYIGDDGLVYAL